MKTTKLAILIFVTGVIAITSAYASLLGNQRIAFLRRLSSHVFQGRVEGQRCYISEDGKRVFTEVSIRILSVIAGTCNETSIDLVTPGGRANGKTTVVVGMPRFTNAEEVVVFVKEMPRKSPAEGSRFGLVGLSEGKYSVITKPNGARVATRKGVGSNEVEINLNDLLEEIVAEELHP